MSGELSLNQARKLTPVLSAQNSRAENLKWIEMGKNLSQRQLEKEVAKVRPRTAVPEKATYISDNLLALQFAVSEELMLKLRRVQDLVSQNTSSSASLEESLEQMVELFLKLKDPVRKAKRVVAKKGTVKKGTVKNKEIDKKTAILTKRVLRKPVSIQGNFELARSEWGNKHEEIEWENKYGEARQEEIRIKRQIPAAIKHQVFLKFKGRCAKCDSKRWLQIHHLKPWSQGGSHEVL